MKRYLKYLPLSAFIDLVNKSPRRGKNLDALDGIRGMAVLIVILAHTHSFGMSKHGGVGVWLFYCLSGFLLSLPYALSPQLILQKNHLLHYFSRRVRRIFPAFYAWIIIWFLFYLNDPQLTSKHLFFQRADGHLWSIPQELVFYLILPVILFFSSVLTRINMSLSILMLLGLTYYSSTSLSWLLPSLPGGNLGTIKLMLGNFLAGVSFAYIASLALKKQDLFSDWYLTAIGFITNISLLLLLSTAPYFIDLFWRDILPNSLSPYLSGYLGWRYPLLYGTLSALIITGVILAPKSYTARFMSLGVLRVVGIVSFSMYLIHGGVLRVYKDVLLWPDGLKLAIPVLLISFFLALLFYHYIERPFMKWRTKKHLRELKN